MKRRYPMNPKTSTCMRKDGIEAYKYMWKNTFDFLGVSTRKEFLYAIFIHAFIVLFLQFVFHPLVVLLNLPSFAHTLRLMMNLFFIASAISIYTLSLRRIRSAGLNPIFGFGIPMFVFYIGFMIIIIGNMSNINTSVVDIISNPYPYMIFIFQNNDMMPFAQLVMGFLKFITASLVVLLHINLALVFLTSFLKSDKKL
jgi:uncharacterized membrane protein YhaH (DUF805 family)